MTVHLLTGHAGAPHVTSDDQRHENAVLMGAGAFIVSGCACTIKDNNTLHIAEGMIYVNGAFVRVTAGGQDVAILSGVVGETRTDYVVLRYTLGSNNIESAEIVCKKGARATAGNILDGANTAEFDLYSVTLTGVSVGTPVQVMPSFSTIAALGLGILAGKNSLQAGDIPSIDASKVTSGTFNAERIPVIGDSKINGVSVGKVSGLGTGATISPSDYPVAVKVDGGKNTFNYIKFNSGACLIWGWFQDASRRYNVGEVQSLTSRALPFTVYHAAMSFLSCNWNWLPFNGVSETSDVSYTAAECRAYPTVGNTLAVSYMMFIAGRWK